MNHPSHTATAQRRYDIDALRVMAFGLLILYHVGMFYVADWGWHLKSAYLAEWLQLPMLLLNQWRLPLLFVIAGIASTLLLKSCSGRGFARRRLLRLGLPLLFGMLLIVPPQAYLQAVSNGAYDGGYLAFLQAYFGFKIWPAGAFDGSEIGITWNHLWFLPYLLSYSLLLAAISPLLRTGIGQAALTGLRSARGPLIIIAPLIWFLIGRLWLGQQYPETHAFFDDWHAHWVYGSCFFLGVLLGTDTGIWREIAAQRWGLFCLAIATYLLLMAGRSSWSEEASAFAMVVGDATICANGWLWVLAVLAWGHQLLNRPFRWLPYATEAVYPWYILHQTITVLLGYQLAKWSLGPVIEPVLLIAGTALGCLLLHEYLIRRRSWLRPLFGLKPMPASKPNPAKRQAIHPKPA